MLDCGSVQWIFCAVLDGLHLNCFTKHQFHYDSYHCEEVLILHNQPHPPPPILLNDTKVGRCNGCFSWQQLEVVTEPYSVCQLCGGGHTRDLCAKMEREE